MSDRLAGVDPEVRTRVIRLLQRMAELGHPMMVTDGFRSVERQQALYALGRTVRGKVVTHCDGVRRKSRHQSGRAVDCTFLADLDLDGEIDDPSWDLTHPWDLFGHEAEQFGFVWGGRWKMRDLPHIELP